MQKLLKSLVLAMALFPALAWGDLLVREVRGETAAQVLDATGVRGGLVVHVGCGDGKLTAAFGRSDGLLVHGLDRSEENVAAAREHVRALGLYGKVSIGRWEGERLPYVDNLINLLVVEGGTKPAQAEMLRVLAPHGVAYVKSGGGWRSSSSRGRARWMSGRITCTTPRATR